MDNNQHLARRDDPTTSADAAASLNLTPESRHEMILAWLKAFGPATDIEMAEFLVRRNACQHLEQGRRLVRTLREEHNRIMPAFSKDSQKQLTRKNPSGRMALAWVAVPEGVEYEPERRPDKPVADSPELAEAKERIAEFVRVYRKWLPVAAANGPIRNLPVWADLRVEDLEAVTQ